jgi:hypothetical protein
VGTADALLVDDDDDDGDEADDDAVVDGAEPEAVVSVPGAGDDGVFVAVLVPARVPAAGARFSSPDRSAAVEGAASVPGASADRADAEMPVAQAAPGSSTAAAASPANSRRLVNERRDARRSDMGGAPSVCVESSRRGPFVTNAHAHSDRVITDCIGLKRKTFGVTNL